MKTIYRYQVPVADRLTVQMPAGATVLSVRPSRGRLDDQLDVWAVVDTSAPDEARELLVVGTGNPLPDDVGAFVGTVLTHGGVFVWHVFEAAPERA